MLSTRCKTGEILSTRVTTVSLVLLAVLVFSCSGRTRHIDPPADGDVTHDAGSDSDVDINDDGDIGDPSSVPRCGDGVLDPEEECDDHNRLNGDGCDWLCRIGDGEPVPEPDPDASVYVPSMPEQESSGNTWRGIDLGLPLVWNGSSLAVTVFEPTPSPRPEESETHIRFFESSSDGEIGGAEWNYPVDTNAPTSTEGEGLSLDLVWTGEGYGLFYTSPEGEPWTGDTSLWFLLLDSTGKPIGDPVLLYEGHLIVSVDADRTEDGFIIAYTELNGRSGPCMRGEDPLSSLTLRAVRHDGSPDELREPLLVSENVIGRPSIASGEEGFGISVVEASTATDPWCSTRFVRVGPDLRDVVTAGALANSIQHDVVYDGDDYVVALLHWASSEWHAPGELCIARYTEYGMLSSPPVCNGSFSDYDLEVRLHNISIDFGDDGLAVVLSTEFHIPAGGEENNPRVFFFVTDTAGRQIASPVEIDRSSTIGDVSIVWTGDGYSTLHSRSGESGSSTTDSLVFNRFTSD